MQCDGFIAMCPCIVTFPLLLSSVNSSFFLALSTVYYRPITEYLFHGINVYSMKQPDLFYFEDIKMASRHKPWQIFV